MARATVVIALLSIHIHDCPTSGARFSRITILLVADVLHTLPTQRVQLLR